MTKDTVVSAIPSVLGERAFVGMAEMASVPGPVALVTGMSDSLWGKSEVEMGVLTCAGRNHEAVVSGSSREWVPEERAEVASSGKAVTSGSCGESVRAGNTELTFVSELVAWEISIPDSSGREVLRAWWVGLLSA